MHKPQCKAIAAQVPFWPIGEVRTHHLVTTLNLRKMTRRHPGIDAVAQRQEKRLSCCGHASDSTIAARRRIQRLPSPPVAATFLGRGRAQAYVDNLRLASAIQCERRLFP